MAHKFYTQKMADQTRPTINSNLLSERLFCPSDCLKRGANVVLKGRYMALRCVVRSRTQNWWPGMGVVGGGCLQARIHYVLWL